MTSRAGRDARAAAGKAAAPDEAEQLILVDEGNRRIGTGAKYAVHRRGLLHRAFSIFLFDAEGRTLLQRRAAGKYHSAGLWANACCGHPRPGEATRTAAARRLREELNVDSALSFAFNARYRAALGNGMTENELVYIYAGCVPAVPIRPDPGEADATALVALGDLVADAGRRPDRFAYWLRHYLSGHGAELTRLADAQRRRGA